MDFSAFSHGQIQSKLWLCEQLEPYVPEQAKVVILGSWYNVLGLILLLRNPTKYNCIHGLDIDEDSVNIANKLCDAWVIEPNYKIENICADAQNYNLNYYDVIISTSCEDIKNNFWFNAIAKDKLVCLQSTNLDNSYTSKYKNWNIQNPNLNIEIFQKKFPVTQTKFLDAKLFDYGELSYKRFMLIGIT
jgi:hypothetical protein